MKSDKGDTQKAFSTGERGYILDTIFQGFLFLLPLTIILIILSFIFNFIFEVIEPLSSAIDPGTEEPRWWIKLISLMIFMVIIFAIGIMVKNRLGKFYFKIFERKCLAKLPLYNLIHQTVYQFVGLKKFPFSKVVLLDPYQTGTLMTGFVTDQIKEELYTVFVPTAPNPTNGNIYHVPKKSLTFLEVSPQDAMRTIMGMGTGSAEMMAGMKTKDIQPESALANEFVESESPNPCGKP
jgi:uncharacterized membrane protein